MIMLIYQHNTHKALQEHLDSVKKSISKVCDPDKRIIQVKYKILPPQNLQYPVLCVNINNILLSSLCRTCADQKCKDVKNNNIYTYNEEERALYGFFDEIELIHAINLGYKILEIFQTHLYQTTTFYDDKFKGKVLGKVNATPSFRPLKRSPELKNVPIDLKNHLNASPPASTHFDTLSGIESTNCTYFTRIIHFKHH
ncbi:Conserved_hypothetical protein [Hexamita inflata]|uniref:Uncharacterized protein n=1 Tax=Hexamita inflata TaxID=28002 RepID=A0ABP1IAP7_9EUKA